MSESTETKTRRSQGEDGVYFNEKRNRWIATVVVDSTSGKRKSGSGTSRTAALKAARKRADAYKKGLVDDAEKYTVRNAITDWLEYGHGDADPDTYARHDYLSRHVLNALGPIKLRDLKTTDVEKFLKTFTTTHSTRTIGDIKWCLNTAVRRAMARDLAERNVVELAEVPRGRAGRPSRALTKEQALGILRLTKTHRMYAYIVVSLLTGVRTEEMRALRWEQIDLNGEPASISVWRSVRKSGDTKTELSRRTLGISALVAGVLHRHKARQDADRVKAAGKWTESGLVFTTTLGTGLDAANVRRSFRHALGLVPGINPAEWVPRELRHSFTSLMSAHGIANEEIARVLGHSGTAVLERIYRHELRPVIETTATAMDQVFSHEDIAPDWHMDPLFTVGEAGGGTRA
ncbi:tyrosine recombinase XerC [Promicromonospora sp. NPDC090134]|uniref:site-specific integrase n=1 Tax=Promicromonospora sp. NPDC090134 TaxID=3364408 RepID=UPI00381CB1B3